jgi:protein-disulfide isomerase
MHSTGKILQRFKAVTPTALLTAGLMFGVAATAHAQSPTTNVKDSAPLHPPAGYRVAIVEWQDLECPDCARAFPIVSEAVNQTHVPWVEHDFPLKFHKWSFDAAVDARYIDSVKGHAVGDEFRGQVFAAQMYLHSKDDIKTFAQKFAAQHGMAWPFLVDPSGKLTADVTADYALGEKVGIDHTPTIWVVTNGRNGAAQFTEVTDRSKLVPMINQAIQQVGGLKDAAPAMKAASHKAAK